MRRISKEKRKPARNFKPLGRIFLFILVVGILAGGYWLKASGQIAFWQEKAIAGAVELSLKAGFKVDQVTIEGRKQTSLEQVQMVIKPKRGDPIFAIDLESIRVRLETLPWVRQAVVERRLPGNVYIKLVEKEAIARWQRQGRFVMIDREGGEILDEPKGGERNLPLVVGEDAAGHVPSLFLALSQEAELWARVKAVVFVGQRRWNVKIDDLSKGVDIRLPDENPEKAWGRLAKLEREYRILNRQISMIDLRLPDRLIVATITPHQPENLSPSKPKNGKDA